MNVFNAELLAEARGSLKFILNDDAIVFFPVTQQHRDIKVHGLNYEDDYRGNAVAGLVTENRVEIRFHSGYSDQRLKGLWNRVLQNSTISRIGLGCLFYQGRQIQ